MRKRTIETKEIINMYKNGMSTKEIGSKANVSARYIRMLLNDNDVEMRAHGSWRRKYSINEDYFKSWSNNMAYILGFFIADGMVARDAQLISFSQKEKYILENIRHEMRSNHPIIKNESTGVYILNLNSKIMRRDLIELYGVMPNKAHQIAFPNVPDKYLSHFIRGYFDGDGYVNYQQYTVTFVGGSKKLIEDLYNILDEIGYKPQMQIQDTNYRVHIRGRKNIQLFSTWIYNNACEGLYLTRKYEIFKKETKSLDDLTDRKHINTAKAVMKRKLDFLTIYAIVYSTDYACECIGIQPESVKRWIKNDKLFKFNFNVVKSYRS